MLWRWRRPPAGRLYARSGADRWQVSAERLHLAVERSLDHRFPNAATEADAAVYLESLHADDLALACACIDGHDGAWEHFIRELRPQLYHAARTIAGDDGRELADSIVRRVVRSPRQGRSPTLAARPLPRPQPADHVAAIGPGPAPHRPSPRDPAAGAARRRGFRRFDARGGRRRIRTPNAISWSVTRSGRSTPASTRSRQRTGCDSASITART